MKKLTKPQQRCIEVMLGKRSYKDLYCKSSFAIRYGNSIPRMIERQSSKRAMKQLIEMGLVQPADGITSNIATLTSKFFANYSK